MEDTKKKTTNKEQKKIWTIHKIHNGMVDLQFETGNLDTNIPLSALYDVLKESGSFKRIDNIRDDATFLAALK